MSPKEKDRRVKRTRRALQNALIHLILEKGYEAVTIEEITNQADLGRTTFYLHFRDKEDLFIQTIDSICEDFIEEHESLLSLKDTFPYKDHQRRFVPEERILTQIFNHARQNADLYRVMLRSDGASKASQRFSTIIQNETIKRLKRLQGVSLKVPEEVFAAFFSGTLIELVTWWLENEQPYTIKAMVGFYQHLFTRGALDTVILK